MCAQGKSFFDKRDVASARLFNRVNEQLLRKPTFASFIRLLVRTDASVHNVHREAIPSSCGSSIFPSAYLIPFFSLRAVGQLHRADRSVGGGHVGGEDREPPIPRRHHGTTPYALMFCLLFLKTRLRSGGKHRRCDSRNGYADCMLLCVRQATPVMRYCHAYLAAKRVSPADPTEFKKQLGGMFGIYYDTFMPGMVGKCPGL